MAVINLVPKAVRGGRVISVTRCVRAKAVMTTSYVFTDPISLIGDYDWNRLSLSWNWTLGDETSLQLVAEKFNESINSWERFAYIATQASAVSLVSDDVLSLVLATFGSVTDVVTRVLPPMDVSNADTVRFGVKSTGGTPTGLVGLYVQGEFDLYTGTGPWVAPTELTGAVR